MIFNSALNSVVPHGSQHQFNYSYDVDNSLATLANYCKDRISLHRFSPTSGSDVRQYCSALLNLPMVQVTRTQYACYHDYHTSNDNQSIFSLDSIVDYGERLKRSRSHFLYRLGIKCYSGINCISFTKMAYIPCLVAK